MDDLSLHLLDIMQNSLEAEASCIETGIRAGAETGTLTLYVRDNGFGMTEETACRASEPFYTTKKTGSAGLGIPLFKESAEAAGGSFLIQSEPGKGTVVAAVYSIRHEERKPLGDVAETMAVCIMGHPEMDFHLILENDDSAYVFRTEDVREQIGNVPLNDPVIVGYLKETIEEQIKKLFGGILNEITG